MHHLPSMYQPCQCLVNASRLPFQVMLVESKPHTAEVYQWTRYSRWGHR